MIPIDAKRQERMIRTDVNRQERMIPTDAKRQEPVITMEAKRHSRVDVADVLRGIAVLGIVILHSIEHFNFYSFPDTATQPNWLNFTDRCIWDGLFFLIGGKAYAIFALLFGFSFFIQDDNQRMQGKDFRLRFCWRLLVLFVIGNLDAVFFTGEILVLYALIGFVLVLTCRLSTRTLLWLAAFCIIQPLSLYHLSRSLLDPAYTAPMVQEGEMWAATFAQQTSGNFWSTAKVNLWDGQLVSLAWAWNNGRVFQTAGLFMLGMVIGRQGWFAKEYSAAWVRVLVVSMFAFFPLHGLSQMLPSWVESPEMLRTLKIIVPSLSKFAFMLVLVSTILLAWYHTRLHKPLSLIIPYGRMSMTCYVTSGMIGAFLFYNWGLGLHRYLGITASVGVGILIFLAQYAFCRWWLSNYKRGPFEATWRHLTWLGA